MGHRDLVVSISDLHFDIRNPRLLDLPGDESEALRLLADTKKKQQELVSLARNIVDNGGLDPTSLLVVTREDRDLVMLEGNRRLACLKLLARPDLAPTPWLRNQFAGLASHFSVPDQLKVVEYDSRKEYAPFLELRHTGENQGAGLKPWTSSQTTKFRQSLSGRHNKHTDLLAWCAANYANDTEMDRLLARFPREDQMTTLNRVLYTGVLKRLGMQFNPTDGLSIACNPGELRPILIQLFTDLLGKKQESGQPWSRASQKDLLDYLDRHMDLLPDVQSTTTSQTSATPRLPRTSPNPRTTPPAGKPPVQARPQPQLQIPLGPAPVNPPFAQASIICANVEFRNFSPKINNLGAQAKKLSIDRYPETCGVLLRVLVDLACNHFLERHDKKPAKQQELWKTVCQCLRILDPKVDQAHQCQRSDLHECYLRTDKGLQGLGVETMHKFVHENLYERVPSEVREINRLYAPLLQAMEENLAQPA